MYGEYFNWPPCKTQSNLVCRITMYDIDKSRNQKKYNVNLAPYFVHETGTYDLKHRFINIIEDNTNSLSTKSCPIYS